MVVAELSSHCAVYAELDGKSPAMLISCVQRIAQDQHNIQYWLDYGAFCLLLEDTFKAQECFREALSLDPHHVRRCCVFPVGGKVMGVLHAADGELLLSPACCSVGLWQLCCSTTKRQRFSLRMLVAWSHPMS